MMYCINCNKECEGVFCSVCGTKLQEKTEEVNNVCDCGNTINDGMNFCSACGKKAIKNISNNSKDVNDLDGTVCQRCNHVHDDSNWKYCFSCSMKNSICDNTGVLENDFHNLNECDASQNCLQKGNISNNDSITELHCHYCEKSITKFTAKYDQLSDDIYCFDCYSFIKDTETDNDDSKNTPEEETVNISNLRKILNDRNITFKCSCCKKRINTRSFYYRTQSNTNVCQSCANQTYANIREIKNSSRVTFKCASCNKKILIRSNYFRTQNGNNICYDCGISGNLKMIPVKSEKFSLFDFFFG